jgi:hypothetical protein
MKKMKIILSFLLFALLTAQNVRAFGLTQPILEKSSLIRGESSTFYFEIQTSGYSNKQSCIWSVSGLNPLEVKINEMSAIVDSNGIKQIYGTVSIPSDATLKTYQGTLSVSCQPYEESGGGSVIKRTANVPFVVNVVETVEKRTEQKLPESEKEKPTINLLPMLVIIILVILVICLVYLFKKKKK